MITAAAWTHPGLVRRRNEDAIALPGVVIGGSPTAPLAMKITCEDVADGCVTLGVVDGMGGHVGGTEASTLVAQCLATNPPDVREAIALVNDHLYDEMDRQPALRGMGATVAVVQFSRSRIGVFNVGDARVYSHADGYTTLITTDDRSASGTGEITQSVGGATHRTGLSVHCVDIDPETPARFLLCSDGLSEYVAFGALQETLDGVATVEAARRLVALAVAEGAPDNVSVVVADWVGSMGLAG